MTGRSALSILQHLHRLAREQRAGKLSDRECLERFRRQRDEEAFAVLVRRHGSMVRGVCRRVLRHAEDAEDVFQATFLVLARKAGSIRWKRSIAPWLYQVAYRLAHKGRVQAARRRELQATVEPAAKAVDESWREVCAVLDEELHNLTEKYRAPLVLCYLEGQTRDEAAERLGWSLGTIKRRLQKGRELLRLRLMHRGVTLPAVLLPVWLSSSEVEAALSTLAVRALAQAATVFASGGTFSGPHLAAIPLAEAELRMMAVSTLKLTAVLLLALSLAAGAGLWTCRMLVRKLPQAQTASPSEAETERGERQAEEDERPRTDRYGDPLPPGALTRFGTLRLRHAGEVRHVVFSPDGKMLASAGNDTTARLWDARTGKELRRLAGHPSWVSSVAFSPDGRLVASGSHGPHGDPSHPVLLWDAATGKQSRRLVGHKNEVQTVTFSPDGKLLASAGYGKSIRLWDMVSGEERHCLEAGTGIYALAFSPDGRLLASGAGGKDEFRRLEAVILWDVAKGIEVRRLPGRRAVVSALAFSADGKTLAVGANDGIVRLCEVETGTERRLIRVGEQRVNSLAFLRGDKALLSGGYDGTIQLWDTVTGAKLPLFADSHEGQGTVSADEKRLATWRGSAIQLWDMATGKEITSLPGHCSSVRAAAFTDGGKTLISSEAGAAPGFALCFWETATSKQRRRIVGLPERGRIMTFSPDAAILVAAQEHLADLSVRLWDVKSGKRLHTLAPALVQGREGVTAVAFAADGRTLATATGNGMGDDKANYAIQLWDTATGRELRQWPAHKSTIEEICFSPDSRLLISASWDRTLCLWSTTTGKQIHCLKGHTDGARTAAVSPDGRLLVSAGQDGTLRLWELLSGGEILRIKAWATRLAFFPDGRTLASVNGLRWNNVEPDNAIRFWNVMTGEAVGELVGHPDGVTLLHFSPDGRVLVSGGDDSTLLAWDVPVNRKTIPARTIDLALAEFETCWRDLGEKDAAVAYKAIGKLTTASTQAVEFLGKRLGRQDRDTLGRIAALINRLDDDRFSAREEATTELAKLGDLAEPALRNALANRPSLEVRQRLEQLLEKLEGVPPSPTTLCQMRAIAVLEHIGTEPARRVLTDLAAGAPDARLTREAKGALQRLTAAGPSR